VPGEELDLSDEEMKELAEWAEEEAQRLAMADANKEVDKAITETIRENRGGEKHGKE
jgi:hypothetical protein